MAKRRKLFSRRGRKADALTPDGLRITQFPAPVVQLLRLYGAGGSYAQMFARQPNIRTVVELVAKEAAELSLKMYEKVPRSPLLPSDRIEISDHDMMQLLSEPSPGESVYRFWYGLFADIEIFDRAYWLKVRPRGAGTPPEAILRVPPANLIPITDPSTNSVLYWQTATGLRVKNEDLVIFWGYDPAMDKGSISPMETLRRILAEEWAAGQNREGMWEHSLRKDGVIEQELQVDAMSDEARESFLIDVQDALSGSAGSGYPLLLQPGQKWKDVSWSPREMEYIQGRKLNRTETAASFHVPPAMVAAAADNSEPDENTLKFFLKSSLPSRLKRVESEIQAQLLPEFDLLKSIRSRHYVEFNLDAKLRGSPEEQIAIMATAAGGPVITVNEARARLNLPPIPGGDLIFVPLNSIRGGGPQGSPGAPVDVPGEGINPVGTTPGDGSQQQSRVGPGYDGPVVVMGEQAKRLLAADASEDEIESVLRKADDRAAHAKARAAQLAKLREFRARYEERHAAVLEKFFKRQRNVVQSGKTLNRDRWDKELADDLFGVQYQTVAAAGADASKRLDTDVEFDQERTAAYLKKRSEGWASMVNTSTEDKLAEDEEDLDEVFGEDRARGLGTTLTTFALGWGVREAAHQLEEVKTKKTWHVTSDNPRPQHSQLDGEEVASDEAFSSGLMYPGDTVTDDTGQVVGCTCLMTVQAE